MLAAEADAYAAPKPITEAEFLAQIEASHPRLEELAARLDRARAEVSEAERWPNPSIAYDREEVFASGERSADNFVRATIPIQISGRRGMSIDAAETGVAAAKEEIARARFLLLLDARDLYLDAALARLEVDLLRQGRTRLDAILDVVRSRAAAGESSGYDLGRLELELAAHDDVLSRAEGRLAASLRTVAALIGGSILEYSPTDPLDLPVSRTASTAIGRRADQRAALLHIEQAEHALSAAGRAWIPDVALSGGLKTSPIGEETGIGYVAGIAITLPFFDRGQAERDRALADKRAAEAEARFLERMIPVEIANAAEAFSRTRAQAERYRDTVVPKLEAILRQAEGAYREGERPIFELLDAHRTAREVRLRALQLRREARRSELDLLRALGPKTGDQS